MQPGQIIQGLRLTHLLGEGGMASVWRAEHLVDGRTVAVKILDPKLARNPSFRQRFFAEGEHQSRLRHPNVVAVEQIVFEPLALVMEWVDGGTLADLLRRGRPPLERVRTLMADITAGVAAAHALQLLHRDIKPQNVLLTRDGVAKVADFGLVRVAGSRGQTRTGQVMGTTKYMAPEQVQGLRQIDVRADVYALGVLLYQLLTGRTPFEGSEYQIALDHVQTPPPDPRTLVPEVPPALAGVVLRALAKDPAARPSDAHMFKVLVAQAFEGDAVALAPTTTLTQATEVAETTEESAMPSTLFEPRLATTEQLVGPEPAGSQPGLNAPGVPRAPDAPAPLPWRHLLVAVVLLALALLGAGLTTGCAEPGAGTGAAAARPAPGDARPAVPPSREPPGLASEAPSTVGGPVEISPEDSATYGRIMTESIQLIAGGRRDEAVALLLEAHRLRPDAHQPHQRLCAILPRLDRQADALTQCKLWRAKEPNPLHRQKAESLIEQLEAELAP